MILAVFAASLLTAIIGAVLLIPSVTFLVTFLSYPQRV
jgi:hypothetical protein